MQVLEDAVTKLQTMFQQSQLFDPCSTLEHQTWSNNPSQHDLLCGDVSLLISLNLKLAPVPYATVKRPITTCGILDFYINGPHLTDSLHIVDTKTHTKFAWCCK